MSTYINIHTCKYLSLNVIYGISHSKYELFIFRPVNIALFDIRSKFKRISETNFFAIFFSNKN